MFWTIIKKYWNVVLLVVSATAGYFFFRREQDRFSDRYNQLQIAHDDEMRKIQSAREEERKQHEENLKRLQDTLDLIQKQYDEDKRAFEEKKKEQVTQIVKKYGKSPEELAKRVSEVTGFKIIFPEE